MKYSFIDYLKKGHLRDFFVETHNLPTYDEEKIQAIYKLADIHSLDVNDCLRLLDKEKFTIEIISNISKLMLYGKSLSTAIEFVQYPNIYEIILALESTSIIRTNDQPLLDF